MVSLAPQLTPRLCRRPSGQPFPKHMLDAITSVEIVDEFDGYPDKWLTKSQEFSSARTCRCSASWPPFAEAGRMPRAAPR